MRRCTLALIALALVGCTPDVHVHVYDDDDGTDSAPDTDSGFSDASNSASDPTTPTSDSNASQTDSDPTATATDPTATATDPTATDPTSGTDPTGDDSSSGSSTGGDANPYPQPVDGACPGDLGYNLDGAFEFCGPPCGEGDTCPDTSTGNVLVMCVFNPESSMSGCISGMCENVDETCFAGACMLPATHCAPLCSTADAVCPDGMECTNNDVCRFPV